MAWGPLGTAKSSWLCWRAQAISQRAANAGLTARILFVRDTYRNLMDSTFRTFTEWFPDGSAAGFLSRSDPAEFKLNVPAKGNPGKAHGCEPYVSTQACFGKAHGAVFEVFVTPKTSQNHLGGTGLAIAP